MKHSSTLIPELLQEQQNMPLDSKERFIYPANTMIWCVQDNQAYALPDLTNHDVAVSTALQNFSRIIPVLKLRWDDDHRCFINMERYLLRQQALERQEVITTARVTDVTDDISHRLGGQGDEYYFPPDPNDEELVALVKQIVNGRPKKSVPGITSNMLTCLKRNSMLFKTFKKWMDALGYEFTITVQKKK